MIPQPPTADVLGKLVDTAQGRRAPDVWVRGGRVVDVHTEETRVADVTVSCGRIAGVGAPPELVDDHTTVIDAAGSFVLPNYVEPHGHPWMLYNPDSLARFALPLGTSAHVGELLNLQLMLEVDDVLAVWRALQNTPVRWFWAVRAAGQGFEDPDACFPLDDVERLLAEPGVVQLAEVTGWPQVAQSDPRLLDRIALAKRYGLRVDGHGAGASARRLPALAAAGFSADHESIDADDVLTRLRAGLHVMLRNSSLRPDLDEFVELCKDARFAAQLSLTTDGAGPDWVVRHGMIDGMVRQLVAAGVPVARAVRFATSNPASYLRLDEHLGSVAPGRCADLQVLPDFTGTPPTAVLLDGVLRAADGALTDPWPAVDWSEWRVTSRVDPTSAKDPASYRPHSTPGEPVPVMELTSAGIARRGEATTGADGRVDGAVQAVFFSPDGRHRAQCRLRGFAAGLDALATTYTTSTGLLVLGTRPRAMALAAAAALERAGEGGIAVVEGEEVVASVRLDIASTMSSRPLPRVREEWLGVDAAVRRAGYRFDELLYCLCFLTCDFLPDLRLVHEGLLDVKPYRLLAHAERVSSREDSR